MLAERYDGQDVRGWRMSEKYDGIRALWINGELISREGNKFRPPAWWVAQLPKCDLDGELWMGRGTLVQCATAVRRKVPNDAEWSAIRYMVFDAPGDETHEERIGRLPETGSRVLYVSHWTASGIEDVLSFCAAVLDKDGEGAILRDPNAPYIQGRTDKMLKFKPAEYVEHELMLHSAI